MVSGVGAFATQMAAAFGAKVTAVTSHRNLDWMYGLSAQDVLDYTVADCCDGASEYDVFFDCYGNRRYADAARVLKDGGIYISTIPALRTFGSFVPSSVRPRVALLLFGATGLI